MTKAKSMTMSVLLTLLMAAFGGNILAGEKITIVGMVTEDGLIVDQKGVIYEIGENDKFEAVTKNIDTKVEVKGTVQEDDHGNKIIMINSFKVLE